MNLQQLPKEQKVGLALGIVAVILIIIAVAQKPQQNEEVNADITIEQATSTPTSTTESLTNTNKPAAKPTVPKSSYEDKIAQYEGRRFQINDSCQVFPAQTTFTNNTAVMFDNRSPIDRVISLSGKDFTVKARGWIEMKLTSKTLPNTINVSCGGLYNVAKIILQ